MNDFINNYYFQLMYKWDYNNQFFSVPFILKDCRERKYNVTPQETDVLAFHGLKWR